MSAAIPGANPPAIDTLTQGVNDVSLASGPPATGDVKSPAGTTHPGETVPAGSYIVTPVAGGGSQVTPISPNGSALSPNGSALSPNPAAGPSSTLSAGSGAAPVSVDPTTGAPIAGSHIASPTSAQGSTIAADATPVSPTSAQGSAIAPAAAGAVGGAAAASAIGSQKNAAPAATAAPAMAPKEIKKYDKLLQTEAKSEERALKQALSDAAKAEKAFRKAVKAEVQSQKRHVKAVRSEHKTAKELSKANVAHEKAGKELEKAKEELEIKDKHKAATNEEFSRLKKAIEQLRADKAKNDRERAQKAAAVHGAATAA